MGRVPAASHQSACVPMLAAIQAVSGAPANTTSVVESRRSLQSFGWSSTVCLLDANGALVPDGSSQSCVSPEPTLAQPCEVGQTGLCKSQTRNGVDSGRWTNAYQFDFCTQQLLSFYTTSGSFSRTTCDAADTTCRWYCAQHESTGAWSSRQRP